MLGRFVLLSRCVALPATHEEGEWEGTDGMEGSLAKASFIRGLTLLGVAGLQGWEGEGHGVHSKLFLLLLLLLLCGVWFMWGKRIMKSGCCR